MDDGRAASSTRSRSASTAGCARSSLYVIPEYQNPTGRTLPLERRERAGRAVPPPRRADPRGRRLPRDRLRRRRRCRRCGRSGPTSSLQAGTFSKIFCPGVRLGWAVGPREVVAQLAAAKQTTDQCAGALGQRMVEEYGRAGALRAPAPARPRAVRVALARRCRRRWSAHMPEGVAWSEPTGGFFTWLTLPSGLDARELRAGRVEAGRHLRPRAAVLRRRRRPRRAAPLVQPPRRGRARARRRAARRRRARRASTERVWTR